MPVNEIVYLAVAAFLLFLFLTALLVRSARTRVATAWASQVAAMNARAKLATRLAATVQTYAGDEPVVTQLATAADSCTAQPSNRVDKDTAVSRERVEGALVGKLRQTAAFARQYPELQGDPFYRDLQGQLEEIQRNLAATAAAYTKSAARLNRRLARRLLQPAATLLRCSPAPSFDPGDAVDAG